MNGGFVSRGPAQASSHCTVALLRTYLRLPHGSHISSGSAKAVPRISVTLR